VERAGAPDEQREHIVALGEDDGRAQGSGQQRDDHAGEDHRQRLEPAPPAQPEHESDGEESAGERDAFAREDDRCGSKGGRDGQRQLRARDDAERRGVGDRITQDALQQQAGEPERGAADQRGDGTRDEAAPEQDMVELPCELGRCRHRRARRHHGGEQRRSRQRGD
jgi:hypothetical protein